VLVQESWVDWPDVVYDRVGNIMLSRIMGADVRLVDDGFDIGIRQSWEDALKDVEAQGGRPYAIPAGASVHKYGGLGYVGFAEEVRAQEAQMGIRFDYIVVCVVTGSTQAGMIVGFAADDRADRVIGIDASGTPAQTRAEWRRAAERTIELARACDLDAEMAVHGLRIPLSLLLVVRAFELWVHDNDIRQAVGLPPSVPDPATLGLMTEVAARLLPHAAARTGVDEPMSLHLVLTGPGGGAWDIAVGQGPPAPAAVAIVTDAVGFCRLAGNRIAPAGLDSHVTGDEDRATAVLAAVATLALD